MFGLLEDMWDYACENPIKTVLLVGGTAVTIASIMTPAGPIAATIGKAGFLGNTAKGIRISQLTGAALQKASLAAIGNGTVASGGGGIAAGIETINTACTIVSSISGTMTTGLAVEEVVTS